jgi:geranylgeranyl diphosphate synthase type II
VEQNIFESIPKKSNQPLYDAYKYIMSGGGKRIRPVLAMICCGTVGGNPTDAINPASAIEILHNFTLLHDDIMDNSAMRHGRHTVHLKWNEDVAILAGDMMVGWAFRLLQETKLKNENRLAELNLVLSNALIDVCEGQELDMTFNSRSDVEISEYISMVGLKTSALLRCAAKLGAITGDASDVELSALDSFAENLGIAFQIQDDILDFTANNTKFGKKIGQDIIEGKKTFPILKAVELATVEGDVNLLYKYLKSKEGLSEGYVNDFIDIFTRLDIFEIAQNEIDKYFDLAQKHLSDCAKNEYSEMLNWLLRTLNKRQV